MVENFRMINFRTLFGVETVGMASGTLDGLFLQGTMSKEGDEYLQWCVTTPCLAPGH